MQERKRTVSTSISFERAVWDRLKAESVKQERSLAWLVNHALRAAFRMPKGKRAEK